MFESLIADVLNKVLGDFIEGIKADQLNISVFSGIVELENMAIKSSLFDSMPVPFQLAFGKIGKIKLDIPMTNIMSKPLVIQISDVLVVLRPKPMGDWSEEVEIKAFKESTMSMIKNFELIQQQASEIQQKDPGAAARMVQNIIANVRIDISNIFIRLEDQITSMNRGSYALGISLQELSIKNADLNWVIKEFMNDGTDFMRKVASIKGFSITMDWTKKDEPPSLIDTQSLYTEDADNTKFRQVIEEQIFADKTKHKYLLDSFALETRVCVNSMPVKNKMPQIEVSLVLGGQHEGEKPGIQFELCAPQISRILKLTEYTGFYNEFREGALAKYRLRTMSFEQSNSYVKLYCSYKNAEQALKKKKNKDNQKRVDDLEKELQEIEQEYTFAKIKPLRDFGMKMLKNEKAQADELEKIRKEALEMKSKKMGWSGFMSSQATKDKIKAEVEEFQKKLEAETKNKYEASDAVLDAEFKGLNDQLKNTRDLVPKDEEMKKMASDYIRFTAHVNIPAFALKVENEFGEQVLVGGINDIDLNLKAGNGFAKILFEIESMQMQEKWTRSSSFSYIMDTMVAEKNQSKSNPKVFSVLVDQNVEYEISPLKIKVRSDKTLFMVANVLSFKELGRMFAMAVEGDKFDFAFFKDLAGSRAVEYRESGKKMLEELKEGNFSHQGLDVTVHLTPPVIVIPQDIYDQTKSCVVLDMGALDIVNSLQMPDPKLDYKALTNPTRLYDRYNLTLNGIELRILPKGIFGELNNYSNQEHFSIVKDIALSAGIFKAHDLFHPTLPSIELALVLESFKVNMHKEMISQLLSFQVELLNYIGLNELEIVKPPKKEKSKEEVKRQEEQNLQVQMIREKNQVQVEEVEKQELKEEEGLVNELKEQGKKERDEKIEELEKQEQPTMNVFVSIERVELCLVECKFDRKTDEYVTKDFLLIQLRNMGLEMLKDKHGNMNIQMGFRKFLITNKFKDEHIHPDFRNMLGSPQDLQFQRFEQREQSTVQTDVKQEYLNSCLKNSLIAKTLFSTIQEHQTWVESSDIPKEFVVNVGIQGTSITLDGAMKKLRIIVAMPTLERALAFNNSVMPLLEKTNKRAEIQKHDRLKFFEKLLDQNFKPSPGFEDLVVRNIHQVCLIFGVEDRQGFKDAIEFQKHVINPRRALAKWKEGKIKKSSSSSSKNFNQAERAVASALLDAQTRQKEQTSEMHVKFNLESFQIWVPLNCQDSETQIFTMGFNKTELGFIQEQTERVYIDDDTLLEMKKVITQKRQSIILLLEKLQMQTCEGSDVASLVFENKLSNQLSMLVPVDMKCNINQKMERRHQTGSIYVTIEPMNFKIGFRQIEFLCQLLVNVQDKLQSQVQEQQQMTPEQKLLADIEAKKKARQLKKDQKKKQKELEALNEENKEFDSAQNEITFACPSFGLQVTDETGEVERTILEVNVKDINLQLGQNEKPDSPADFYLKKIGIWQKRGGAVSDYFLSLQASLLLEVKYFNFSTLVNEPCIEPWTLKLSVKQANKFAMQQVDISSESILNLNITYAMAVSLSQVKQKALASIDLARKPKGELREETIRPTSSYNKSQTRSKAIMKNLDKEGYIFRNSTGVHIDILLDEEKVEEENKEEESKKSGDKGTKDKNLVINQKVLEIKPGHESFFLISTLEKALERKQKGRQNNLNIAQHCLTCDIQIPLFNDIKRVQFDSLGVHAHSTTFDPAQQKKENTKQKEEENKEISVEQAKKDALRATQDLNKNFMAGVTSINDKILKKNKLSLVCNVKIEGKHKIVQLESPLVLSNVLSQDIVIGVGTPRQNEREVEGWIVETEEISEMITINSQQAFPAPLTWFINNQCIYMKREDGRWIMVQRNLFETLTMQFSLQSKNSKVYSLAPSKNIGINMMAFICKPKLASTPHQYLMSFDEPVIITNKTFSPLSATVQHDRQNSETIALMKPNESTSCYHFNNSERYDLLWSMLDKEGDFYTYQERGFQMKLQNKTSRISPFFHSRVTSKCEYLCVDTMPIVNKEAEGYDEEFELRDMSSSLISSQQIMIYPKYILVNKTGMDVTCGGPDQGQQVTKYSQVYLSGKFEKVKFKVDGYNWSQDMDLKTIGVSGELDLSIEGNKAGLRKATASVPYKFAPEKLQLGVKIQQCFAPYQQCTKVEIVPRFVVVNQLNFPVVLKQTGSEKLQAFRPQVEIEMEEEKREGEGTPIDLSWVFEKNNKENTVQMRELTDHEQENNHIEQTVNEDLWSPSFPISDLEDFQICMLGSTSINEEIEWFMPHKENSQRRFIRVVITTKDEATLLVVFSDPLVPEYSIQNKSDIDVKVFQKGIQDPLAFNCKALKNTAFAWQDRFKKERFMEVIIQDEETKQEFHESVDIEKVAKGEPHQTRKECKLDIGVAVQGSNKTLILQDKNKAEQSRSLDIEKVKAFPLMQLLDQRLQSNICLNLDLDGISISMIDNEPKELMLISMCDLDFTMREWNEIRKIDSMLEKNTNININLGHLQIDNMNSESMPVIFAPTRQYISKMEYQMLKEEAKGTKQELPPPIIPFIQVDITKTSFDDDEYEESTRVKVFEVILQEIAVKVDTAIIDANLKFVNALVGTLSDKQAKFNYVERYEGQNQKIIEESMLQIWERKALICEDLDANTSIVPKDNLMNFEKMYLDFLHLGAIHIILTFKFEKKAFEFDISNPSGLFGVGNIAQGFFSSVISISNSPLKFTEVIIMDKFMSSQALGSQLGKNYAKQGVAQFYKLLGCSDIIGNPVGLIGKVGTGVYEFVSEPTKGLVQGPIAFAEGIGKGFSSLSSNVISGGMESISNITGSLYSVIKNTTGDSKGDLKKTDGAGEGLVSGIKGGGQEIFDGVTGVFTKPVEKAKEGGVTGFFKGVGSGAIGLVSAPVTAVLRVGSSVTGGIAESTKAKKKDEFGNIIGAVKRFRPPRYISSKGGLTSFDEEMAEAQGILKQVKEGIYYSKSIKAYTIVPRVGYGGEADPNHLIETEQYLVYVNHKKKDVIFVCVVDEIRRADYQEVAERTRVRITIQTSKKQKLELEFTDGQIAKLVFDKLASLPHCRAEDHVQGILHEATV